MAHWPKWLKITFIVSGCLFVLAALFSGYVRVSDAVIPNLSVAAPADPDNPAPTGNAEPTNVVVVITAVTGLVTAASGLYGQILAGRKMKLEYDLARRLMEIQAQSAPPKPPTPSNEEK